MVTFRVLFYTSKFEEEIYDCIRVAHPGFQRASLAEFIVSVDEVVENSSEEEEQCILDTYEPAPLHESDSEGDDTPDIPLVSYAAALEGLETLRLFRLQNPHVNAQIGEQLEALLYREKRDIEVLQGMARGRKQQTTFGASLGHFLIFHVHIPI
ncbi:hypothetical protein EV426DRAFT_706320 [Tirmania nivea]|nr:hypothetical protein EV426DRAFT_706320 [Tirmania nivea]